MGVKFSRFFWNTQAMIYQCFFNLHDCTLNKISEKSLTQFTTNTLLCCLCSNKAKTWVYPCCKAWIAWLCWVCICRFCIMSWLYHLSRVSLSLFSSCKPSDLNSRSCSSFLEENQPRLSKPPTLFLPPVSLSSCPLRFHVSQNCSIAFFSYFLSFLFFVVNVRLSLLSICFVFCVHFLQIFL